MTSGVFPAIMSSTDVKKNVSMDAPPTANGGGHASISNNGSGGYANIGFPNSNQNVCNVYYPAGLELTLQNGKNWLANCRRDLANWRR